MYKTGQLTQMFDVSRQTISVWCNTFAAYLSPNANPEDNSQRRLNDDDVRVLSLVKDMTDNGKTYDTIALALAAGQRGDLLIPMPSPNGIVPAQQQLAIATERIKEIETRLRKAELDRADALGQLTRANAEVESLKKEVRDLMRQVLVYEMGKADD